MKRGVDGDDSVQVVAWGAGSREELIGQLGAIEGGQDSKKLRGMAADLRGGFRADAECRLVVVLQKGHSDVAKVVRGAVTMLKAAHLFRAGDVEHAGWGVFWIGDGGEVGRFVSGAGVAVCGDDEGFGVCAFPARCWMCWRWGMRRLGRAAAYGERLSDRVYPVAVFNEEGRAANEKVLSDTRVAQPGSSGR